MRTIDPCHFKLPTGQTHRKCRRMQQHLKFRPAAAAWCLLDSSYSHGRRCHQDWCLWISDPYGLHCAMRRASRASLMGCASWARSRTRPWPAGPRTRQWASGRAALGSTPPHRGACHARHRTTCSIPPPPAAAAAQPAPPGDSLMPVLTFLHAGLTCGKCNKAELALCPFLTWRRCSRCTQLKA